MYAECRHTSVGCCCTHYSVINSREEGNNWMHWWILHWADWGVLPAPRLQHFLNQHVADWSNLGWHSHPHIHSPPEGPLWPSHRVHLHKPINAHVCFSTESLHRCPSILTCYPGKTSIRQPDMFWSRAHHLSVLDFYKPNDLIWINKCDTSSDLHSRSSNTIITKTSLYAKVAFLVLM